MKRHAARLLFVGVLLLAGFVAQSAPAAPNPVVASATGSGHMVRPDGTFRSFSFSARKYADDSVKGQLQLNSRGFDVFVHIAVDCLRIEGNTAHMSGLITHTSDPDQAVIGELNRVVVRDNGEGHDVIDQVSRIPENENNADQRTCLDPPGTAPPTGQDPMGLLPLRDVHRGNVQVRGE
jgi:hypothetical protein